MQHGCLLVSRRLVLGSNDQKHTITSRVIIQGQLTKNCSHEAVRMCETLMRSSPCLSPPFPLVGVCGKKKSGALYSWSFRRDPHKSVYRYWGCYYFTILVHSWTAIFVFWKYLWRCLLLCISSRCSHTGRGHNLVIDRLCGADTCAIPGVCLTLNLLCAGA